MHGSIHWFAPFRNLLDERDCWITMMVIGPFFKWDDAVGFFHLWSRQTRGKARRMKRGVTLLKCYEKQYNLVMWVQQQARDEIEADIAKMRNRCKFTGGVGKRQRISQMLHPQVGQMPRHGEMTLQHISKIKRRRIG